MLGVAMVAGACIEKEGGLSCGHGNPLDELRAYFSEEDESEYLSLSLSLALSPSPSLSLSLSRSQSLNLSISQLLRL